MKKTPLYESHLKYHAKMVSFHNYLMPIQYDSIINEHLLVRKNAGIFDISHMGKFEISGEDALSFVQQVITNDAAPLSEKQALYSPLCNEKGGIIDDILVYKMNLNKFLFIVNCANTEKDMAWLTEQAKPYRSLKLKNVTDEMSIIALQGPSSLQMLKNTLETDFKYLKRFCFDDFLMDDLSMIISRTGYTGEDGVEILVDATYALRLWDLFLKKNEAKGLRPVGLGARDTLRLEACFLLYGNDMDETVTPLETLIDWTVKFDKDSFIGKESLLEQKAGGVKHKIIGFEMSDQGIPRHDYPVLKKGEKIGKVTSGTFNPTTRKGIGLARITDQHAMAGEEIQIQIRDNYHEARIVKTPFYKRELKK
ncbi:glycine cleavage system aminomethyltransferase GcvT [Candidatus Kuenenia sp.]|uniref:glycine cleavage system aminomethyltransferase GcvT n=1 Tax=Candidatus Kuenenia sp. TaxID=2499824 RepID=UPI00321FE708